MAQEKKPVDVSGLLDALNTAQVNVSEEIAESLATLKAIREKCRQGDKPDDADKGAIYASIKSLQGCSAVIKARPELAGKSAGRVTTAELVAGRDDVARDSRHTPSRLPPPPDFDDVEGTNHAGQR